MTFSLYDINGKLIEAGNVKENKINISNLANGLYNLRIESNNQTVNKNIIKE